MAKYTFQNNVSQVLPESGSFYTKSSTAVVDYDSSYDEAVVQLHIGTQVFDESDLEDLIEFLESLKEHLKGG